MKLLKRSYYWIIVTITIIMGGIYFLLKEHLETLETNGYDQ